MTGLARASSFLSSCNYARRFSTGRVEFGDGVAAFHPNLALEAALESRRACNPGKLAYLPKVGVGPEPLSLGFVGWSLVS